MCGILVYSAKALKPHELQYLRSEVCARGPDSFCSIERHGTCFEASVLSLRSPFTKQPLHDKTDLFCYNGQLYDVKSDECDTKIAYEFCKRGDFGGLLGQEGEFAFVYSDGEHIWFGRDKIGRRSLLYSVDQAGSIIISSVASGDGGSYVECDAGGIVYQYSLEQKKVRTIDLGLVPFTLAGNECDGSLEPVSDTLGAIKAAVARRLVRPSSEQGVALLFSGGLDCSILAAILDDLLPRSATIELLNVAFENRRTQTLWDTPDRLLAHRSLKELRARSSVDPSRFLLREINVPYETAQESLPKIRQLMFPATTVIDLSIALAFYFASEPSSNNSSRILFSGLGADELFAGYSRHTNAARKGEDCLKKELLEDFRRLPHRNLGRDDRVISSWGREARYPFLDNQVVSMASALPSSCKTDGFETKIVLRQVAEVLTLRSVVQEKKRAIQFGAKSAKMDPGSGKLKGHQLLDSI